MPKGSRKGKSDRNHRYDGSLQTSDDDSLNDNVSVVSNFSENKSLDDLDDGGDDPISQFEDKLIEVIDGLTQKSTQGRTTCLDSLRKALIKKYMPSFLRERHFTICDCIERSLKRGSNGEKAAAAELAPLLLVQLGDEDAGEEVDKCLRPLLDSIACDRTVAATVRAKCCLALGLMGFILSSPDTLILMQHLESIFSASYLKGDGSAPNITAESAILHAAALNAWALLLTTGNFNEIVMDERKMMEQLGQLLESPHLDVRLNAGEALALIFEDGRSTSDEFEEDFADEFSEVFRKLATDSHKYRAKKDRKQQRATFRDILLYIEEGIVPDVTVKFGREALLLDTLTKRKQYESLCAILGPGINIHLAENDLVRSIFGISAIERNEAAVGGLPHVVRFRKRMMNAAAFKARTISRGKNRDKRSDF